MRLLILGAGSCQLNAIKKAKNMGLEVVTSDYYPDAPGKAYADYSDMTSTFDTTGILQIANKYNVNGIMTMGTDQPVYTCAYAAHHLSLPTLIDIKTAKAVTNKKIMKSIMVEHTIPTTKHACITKNFDDSILNDFNFPVVIKPLDSQGQRGVFKLKSIEEIRKHFDITLSFSREHTILVEEFYDSDEITVSGWVHNNKLIVLSVTDRLTFTSGSVIGISYGHMFPTKYFNDYYNDIEGISNNLVNAFKIKNGPIYFQMLIGEEGIKVNEIACRIGGAYEDEWLPLVTDIDILDMVINSALGRPYLTDSLLKYNIRNNHQFLSVQLFFAREGKIKYITPFSKLTRLPFVIHGGHNYTIGDEITSIKNAAQRAGYVIITGESKSNLESNIHEVFNHLKIMDEHNNNLVVKYEEYT